MDFRRYDNRWFALRVRVRSEQLCARMLQYKGYEEFLPMSGLSPIGNGDDYGTVRRPLFPGYIFCRLNSNASGSILTTPGVIGIVGNGRIPSPISDEEIGNVKVLVNSGLRARSRPYLHAGEPVRIADGPLRGITGILLRVKNVHRLVLSLDLLQRSAEVEIDATWVESARVVRSIASLPLIANQTVSSRSV